MCVFVMISLSIALGSMTFPGSYAWFSSDSMLSLLEPTLEGVCHFRRVSLLAFPKTSRKADLRASEVSWEVPAAVTDEEVVLWSDFLWL